MLHLHTSCQGEKIVKFRVLATAAMFAAPVLTASAFAAETPAAPVDAAASAAADTGDIGSDIVVTAQKRAEKISNVPITITAYSGSKLREIGVTQFDQLSAYVPGLNVQEQSPNNPGFVIRGITSDSGSSQGSPAVTIYLNGVDVSRSRGSYFDLFDIERVEVVKGPQATLFGTASAIGAVSVITNKPTSDFGGEIRAAYGNYNQRKVDGFINTGGDVLSARLAFAVKLRDGIVPNIAGSANSQTPNGPKKDALNGQGQYGARLSVRYHKGDLLVDAVATYDGQRAPGTAFKASIYAPTGGSTSPFTYAEVSGSPLSAAVLGYSEPHLTRNVYDGNITAKYTPDGPFSFTQIVGYRKFDSNEVFDADGSQAWYLEFAEDEHGEQVSSESRINYDTEKFRGFAGFTFFHETVSQRVPFSTEEGTYLQCAANVIKGLGCVSPTGVVTASQATSILTGGKATVIPYTSTFENFGKSDTYSAFADGTYVPIPRLELTLGARLLIERRESGFTASVPNSVLTKAPLIPGQVDTKGQVFHAEGDYEAFLPRANILYKATDWANLYLTYSRGRRSPVVNLDAAAGGVPRINNIDQEKVTNYEGGIKVAYGKVNASVGYYYEKYRNFQVSVIQTNGTSLTQSAGSATNQGVEAEIATSFGRMLSLFANGAYINAKVDNNPLYPTFSGNQFRLQPKVQASGGGTLTVPLTERFELFATPTVTYRSHIFFEIPNKANIAQGPVTLVNLRAGIQNPRANWQLTAYATNLLNRNYLIDAGNTGGAFGDPTFIRAQPRLFGIEGVYRF